MNQLKYDKIKLKKSDKASKKGNDCNVSQVSLDVNPVPVMYIFGVFRQFLAIFDPIRSPSTLSTPGLGGSQKGQKIDLAPFSPI